jgi:hypothetical protein
MRVVIKVLGWILILLALSAIAAQIEATRKGESADGLIAGLFIILVFGGGGALLLRTARRMKLAADAAGESGPTVEQRVLAAARQHRGRLTAVSVAADGKVSLEQARFELERLAKENACLMEVSADGLVMFRFPEFETTDSRPA